jgi:NAD(P)-dependent dehydrogenase (short-subunit alcohol dehydrogenase family)
MFDPLTSSSYTEVQGALRNCQALAAQGAKVVVNHRIAGWGRRMATAIVPAAAAVIIQADVSRNM